MLTIKQASTSLGIPYKTLQQRIHRAKLAGKPIATWNSDLHRWLLTPSQLDSLRKQK